MARITVGQSFISKQAHMVICSDEVFKGWLKIIQEQDKKPAAAAFRCLAGLEEEDVKQIQSEIRSGEIILSKGAKSTNEVDMAERIKQLKQDKIVQEQLLIEFNTMNKDKQCQNWKELASTYNINKVVYGTILQLCDEWIKSKLVVGSKKIDFPVAATRYIEWNITLCKERSTTSLNLPLSIYVVSLTFDGSLYLKRHLSDPVSIGLCVLDCTEDLERQKHWSAEKFCNLLNGIMIITGGSAGSQYVLLTFLDITGLNHLQNALRSLSGITKEQYNGALHFQKNIGCNGAIQFFTSLVFFSKEDSFKGLLDYFAPGTQATTLDAGLLDIDHEDVKSIPDSEFLRVKKKLLIKQCIQKYCVEDSKLVDLFSDGYVSELGLELKKEVIGLVESIEDQRKLETRLLDLKNSVDEQADQSSSDTQRDFAEGSRCGKARSAKDFLANED